VNIRASRCFQRNTNSALVLPCGNTNTKVHELHGFTLIIEVYERSTPLFEDHTN
jgi:hypothetical protein